MSKPPIRVAVTGGAGQICYSLLFRVAAGDIFGADQPVALNILELPVAMKALEGVAMELEDCAFPLLTDIVMADDVNTAMKDVNWALLVGSKPRGPGMERGDLIKENGPIFTSTGKAINDHAAADIHVLTVGNPCNTNCLIAMHNAPDVPRDRFHAMTRLAQNRAVNQLAKKAGTDVNSVKNVTIWGNHSAKQVPDYHNATINGAPATEVIGDTAWLQGDFVNVVAKRGAAIIDDVGGPFNTSPYDISSSKNDASMIAEFDFGCDIAISRCWSAGFGYRLVGATGIALTTAQVPRYFEDLGEARRIDSTGSLLLHGGYAQIEFVR